MRLAVAILCCLAAPVLADDSKETSVTVLPTTNASLVFTDGDKSATVEYSQLFGAMAFYGKASAPLDEDSRIAAFATNTKLARGFSGTFALGYDERGEALRDLADRARKVADALELLKKGQKGQTVPFAAYAKLHERHANIDASSNTGLRDHLCGAAPCDDNAVIDGLCKELADSCDHNDPAAALKAAMTKANDSSCSGAAVFGDDKCFWAQWWVVENALQSSLLDIQRLWTRPTVALLWSILELADPEKAKELAKDFKATTEAAKHSERAAALLDHIDDVEKAIATFRHRAPFVRRDVFMTGILGLPPPSGARAIMAEVSVDFDQLSVHQDDLAAKAQKESKYSVTFAGDYTYYSPIAGLAANVHAGVGFERDPDAKQVELCKMYPSGDATITGKGCDTKALFRSGAAPDVERTIFARFAASYQYGVGKSDDEIVPGLEVRAGWERHGSDDSVGGRLTLFGTPAKDSVGARVGIALDVVRRINIGDADSRWAVTPLVFVGATFSQLQAQ